MVRKIIEGAADITNSSPRISWSVIVMGASVLVSVALNYAAYDTRITVLERSALASETRISELLNKNETLSNQNVALDRDVSYLRERIQRIEGQLDATKGSK